MADYRPLDGLLPPELILKEEPMGRHTSMKVGGPADRVVLPRTAEQIVAVLSWCRRAGTPCYVMGNGSNLLVRDGGYRGVIVKLSDGFKDITVEGEGLTAQSGALLSAIARSAMQQGLSGLEFAAGIPGSVGGAVAMNAGAYCGTMDQVVNRVQVLTPDCGMFWLGREEMGFSYRHSLCAQRGWLVLQAFFHLKEGDSRTIAARMDDLGRQRRVKQPLNYPSAGSIFKRPLGDYAGRLIEEVGLMGMRVGDAQVSDKHAGFIINLGQATAGDVLTLMNRVMDIVETKTGVRLEPEVQILGEEETA